ncbi:MAG: cytochrome c3 family protein [Armatimonadetes bacterium]|nr:cytochrome c3 family protein [Armatimonadota bacterium]
MMSHRNHLFWIAIFLGAVSLAFAPAAKQAAKPASANRYIGPKTCMQCHHTYANLWAQVKHSQLLLDEKRTPEQKGCEACHGPGKQHAEGKRKEIVAWDSLKPAGQNDICLKCHQGKVEADLWKQTPHASMEMACVSCHEVHKPVKQDDLLLKPEMETCSGCHDLKDDIAKKYHHPLPEGFACGSCHNPHGTKFEGMLAQTHDALCQSCHGKEVPKPESHKAEDFMMTHGPAAKADSRTCTSFCHQQKEFCGQCHEQYKK